MNKWPEINFLDFSLKMRVIIIVFFIFLNIILYALFRKKDINKKLFHKILSMINIFFELFVIVIILYQFHVLFIIFAPFIIMFITLFGYGINTELSDEDKAGLVYNKGIRLSTNINARYIEFIYFPGYYVIESWKNKK
jgi:hypothetical protein